jgi:Reverse transcriptase (RNA-dependent DNA polymerase)
LEEDVYMEQPQGFEIDGHARVCKLIKSLYGLKQAPHVWNKTLNRHLVALGFTCMDSDHGLYARIQEGEITMLLTVYVGDLLLLGPDDMCKAVAVGLQSTFELVALGPVKYLLGVEVIIDRELQTVLFSQEAYIREILKRFHMADCNGVSTPESTIESKVSRNQV